MFSLKIVKFVLVGFILTRRKVELKITEDDYKLMPKLFHLDDFDHCMEYGKKALYCNVILQIGPIETQNKSRVWNIIQEVIRNPRYYRHDQLRYGVCVPDSCPEAVQNGTDNGSLKTGIADCYSSKLEHLGLKAIVSSLHCETDQEFHPIDNYDVAVAIVLAVVVSIIMFASFYEGTARYKSKEEYDKIVNTKVGRVISCFSLPRNWDRLMSRNTDPDIQALKSLTGMRFYNLITVILVHAALCILATSIANPPFVENFTIKPENMILANGLGAIQTFMLVAGFLIAHNFFKTVGPLKSFKIQYVFTSFIYRYLRLTPCLLVVMSLQSTWLYHLGRGPMWDKAVGAEYRNCRRNWWSNLLYVNNYYDVENMCMIHTWYLATDTQLFFVSIFVVTLVARFESFAKLILGVSVVIGFALPSVFNYYYDYDIIIRMYPETMYAIFSNVPQWHKMYSSALVNFGAYALGLTLGYTYYKNSHVKILTTKLRVTIWWIVCWALPLGSVFYAIVIYQDNYEYTRVGAALYASLYRILMAIGFSAMIYGTLEGAGWLFRDILVWPPIEILGRLIYCIYLVHVPITRIRGGYAKTSSYLSYYTMLSGTCSDAVLALIFGTVLTLFVEMPVSALQKLMSTKPQVRKPPNVKEDETEAAEIGNNNEYNQRL